MANKGRTLVTEQSPVEEAAARIQACRDKIEELAATKVELEEELKGQKSDLTTLEDSAGERSLEARLRGDGEEDIVKELSALKGSVSIAEKRLEALKIKQKEATRQLLIARAGELRARAGKLWEEVLERRKVTDKLLEKLFKHEGVPYEPQRRNLDPRLDKIGVVGPQGRAETRTLALVREIWGLEKQATTHEIEAGLTPLPSICGERELVSVAVPFTPPIPGKISHTKIQGHPVYENRSS